MPQQQRVMLIEDSRTQAERVRILLERQGWEVVYAPSSESALELLNHTRPDCIVVDYHLPGMSGAEFCREIRMNVNTRGIPVLMLTVEGTHDAEQRGLESGADAYLAKSVDPDVLVLRVRALLRKSQGQSDIVASESPFARARVLAIDDSPTYLHYLTRELAAERYVVERATGGEQAIEKIRAEPFDCVLVDLEMPGVDGIEVCRRVIEMRDKHDFPTALIVLTAHEEKEFMTLGLEAGADDFIGKSADIAVVKARIRALLRRKFFTEENRRILEELTRKELAAARARIEKEAAEERARMADQLALTNRELEQVNRKLREAGEVTRAITENAAEALFLLDRDGRITFVNPAAARMFGWTPEELVGEVLHDKIHRRRLEDGSLLAAEDCPLVRSLSTGETVALHEDQFFHKDGTAVDVLCSNAPILQDGQVAASVLVVHDISERKRSEERLRQTQKLESIGLLAGGIAHDFNNILTSIIGTASMLADEPLLPEAADMVRTIMTGADKAADLTRQLLAYAGKGQFVSRQIELSNLVREMAALIRLSVPKPIEIQYELQDLPTVPADPGQMQQVLMNLVINAGEAIGEGTRGQVRIATRVEEVPAAFIDTAGAEVVPGRYVCLEVSDTGSGMSEATRRKVFEPFFSTKFTGRGLGLAAVSGILRSQKGAILIDSTPGQGSTFRAMFPVPVPAPKSQPAAEAGRPLVLVVDVDDGVREFLRSALEFGGFRAMTASGGIEALELWQEHRDRIQLVVVDLVMPQMAGDVLVSQIKSKAPEMRILVTSANDPDGLRATYPDALFIRKPYGAQELIRKAKEALA